MMKEPPVLKRVDAARPCANDLLRGWHDAEAGVEYQQSETEDWQLGWRLWNAEHGGRRSGHSWH
jgi:hypothetical protein